MESEGVIMDVLAAQGYDTSLLGDGDAGDDPILPEGAVIGQDISDAEMYAAEQVSQFRPGPEWTRAGVDVTDSRLVSE